MNDIQFRKLSCIDNYSLCFFLVIVVKILIGGFFSSDFMDHIFIPFSTYFTQNFQNPWQFFFENKIQVAFPYNPLMLYILSPFTWIISVFNIESLFLKNILMKLPNFFFDILIYKKLLIILPAKKKEILIYYFCSPIIIYACYAHSQLDLIPTAFLFSSIIYLIKNRIFPSAFLLAAAISTKAHTLMALPFILIYLLKNSKKINLLKYLAIVSSIVSLVLLPYIFSTGFQFFILRNKEKDLVFDVFHSLGDLKIYLAPFALVTLLIRFLVYKKINKDLFISFLGLIFSIFVLFVVPTPGWYVWGIPYLVYFFIRNHESKKEIIIFYFLLSALYLCYFLFFYQHPLHNFANLVFLGSKILPTFSGFPTLKNLFFTSLEALLCITIYFTYSYGVKSNSVYKNRKHAILIGIGGDSGTGKTTVLEYIKALLGIGNVVLLEGDAEHKWERGHENWQRFTHLNPKANFLHEQASHLELLKTGRNTFRTDYDHSSGKFTQKRKIASGNFIVISGLHPFYLPKSRQLTDLKIFLDTEERLRQHWKILRDIEKRGYSKEKILSQINSRNEDADKYINPQKEFADIVFKYYTDDDFEIGDNKAIYKTKLKIICDANLNLDNFLDQMNILSSLIVEHDYTRDLKKQFLNISGSINASKLSAVSLSIIPNQDDFLLDKIQWYDDLEGIIQLFILIGISEVCKESNYEV